jgi:hypothetical protein
MAGVDTQFVQGAKLEAKLGRVVWLRPERSPFATCHSTT